MVYYIERLRQKALLNTKVSPEASLYSIVSLEIVIHSSLDGILYYIAKFFTI